MDERYLLYVDFLGFAELAARSPGRVHDLYQVVASLNLHSHADFRAILFSDTLLAYNYALPRSDSDDAFIVMYLCEFAQDLLYRLVGRDIAFRAVVTRGLFSHYELNGLPCFFGSALIKAYRAEKTIKALGLFIDPVCDEHNNIFSTRPFGDDFSFVFLTQRLVELEDTYEGRLPLARGLVAGTDFCDLLGPEVLHLATVHAGLSHGAQSVREKYENTWRLYEERLPRTTRALVRGRFALEAVCREHDWSVLRGQVPFTFSSVRPDAPPGIRRS